MDSARPDDAWRVIEDGTQEGAYAGAVALVAIQGRVVLQRATGWAVRVPERISMAEDTVFDLASLTKVMATLPAILRLSGEGKLSLDDPVGSVLSEFGTKGWRSEVTFRRLLSHTGGMPAWMPLYLDQTGPEAYLAAIARVEPVARPGEQVIYSDLGFMLLGEVIRRASGVDIATYSATNLFVSLGLRDTMFTPPASLRSRIAATERGNETEREMCGEREGSFTRWRREVIWGEVNDGNSYYGLGGVAGHAGLFGTAADVARYGLLWLNGGRWNGCSVLDPKLVAEATRWQAPGRGLGWRLSLPDSSKGAPDPGSAFGHRAYGHTGFTGTSLWIDPERALVVVLLTNRLHPTARPEIEAVRREFQERVAAACPLLSGVDAASG